MQQNIIFLNAQFSNKSKQEIFKKTSKHLIIKTKVKWINLNSKIYENKDQITSILMKIVLIRRKV